MYKYHCNERFFASINTEDVAYWLGFIFADGNVSSGSSYLQIQLQVKDTPHLQQFLDTINSDHKIYDVPQNNASKIIISSPILVRDLIKWGVTPRKSLTVKYPPIPTKHDRHFIRGVFDGDGSWSNLPYTFAFQLSGGNPSFLMSIANKLQRATIYPTLYKDRQWWKLTVQKQHENVRLFRYLYTGASVCLARKLRHIQEYMGQEQIERCLNTQFVHFEQKSFI